MEPCSQNGLLSVSITVYWRNHKRTRYGRVRFAKIDLVFTVIAEKGLSKMNRNHIHMAVGLPGADEVISGMRQSCNLYIHINTALAIKGKLARFKHARAFEDQCPTGVRMTHWELMFAYDCDLVIEGIKFYKSTNSVILSDGKGGDGFIPPRYFAKVVKSNNEIIFPCS